MNEDYLIHYGVLGMKWGVRKQRKYANKAYRQAKVHQVEAKTIKNILKNNNDSGIELTSKDREIYRYQYQQAINGAKQWLNTREDILSMNLSEINTKHIKERFNKDKYKYGYSPFY